MSEPYHRSKCSTWQTPAVVLDRVRQIGPIGLDPATSDDNPTGAAHHFTTDGLAQSWAGHGLVYVNPPYGRTETRQWTAKMAAEAAEGVEIVALLPARPSTIWWHTHVLTARLVAFWRGRLRFVGADSGAPFPSAIIYWGWRSGFAAAALADHAWVVRLQSPE